MRSPFLRWAVAGAACALWSVSAYAQTVVSADTYLESGSGASTNFGTLASVLVGPGGSAATQNKSLIQFNLSALTGVTGTSVQKAVLWVYVNRVTTAGAIDVYDVTNSWGESTATWNAPPTSGALLGTIPVSGASQWVGLDITTEVQTWLTSPPSNNGIMLVANSSPNTAVSLDSKESTTTSHPAQLQLVMGGGTGGAGATGPSGPAGPSGPSGPAGVGASGPAGPSGATGASGPAGPSGVAGPSGATGLTGPSGPAGPSGATGAAGPSGPAGSAGTNGAAGASGPSGPSGPSGGSSLMFFGSVGNGTEASAGVLSTDSTGQSTAGAAVPVSGSTTGASVALFSGGTAYLQNIVTGAITWFPAPITFTKMNAILNPQNQNPLIVIGPTLTIRAQLYKYTTGYGSTAVPGASCIFNETQTTLLTYNIIVIPGISAVCSNIFSASFNAGEGAYWVVSMTAAGGSQLNYSLPVDVVIGIAQ